MFECRACLRRLVTTFSSDSVSTPLRSIRRPPKAPSNPRILSQQRWQTGEAVLRSRVAGAESDVSKPRTTRRKTVSPRSKALARRLTKTRAATTTATETPATKTRATRIATETTALSARPAKQDTDISIASDGKLSVEDKKRLKHSLKFLVDPLRLAEYVERQLKKNRLDESLKMVRFASSQQRKCIVAWNHIINWLMVHDRANAAIKIFNEVCLPSRCRSC